MVARGLIFLGCRDDGRSAPRQQIALETRLLACTIADPLSRAKTTTRCTEVPFHPRSPMIQVSFRSDMQPHPAYLDLLHGRHFGLHGKLRVPVTTGHTLPNEQRR